MDIITADRMHALIRDTGGPHVSITMPTHRMGRETRQGPIRLGNLLDRAHEGLVDDGLRAPEAKELLAAASHLVDDDDFWQHQEEGLAIFIAPGETSVFRLPADFDERVVIADRFHVKAIWPLVTTGEFFHILALSRQAVDLWWADRYQVGEVDLPDDLPRSLAEALWFDDPEKQLQHHGSDRVGRGRVVASFHGHGVPEERGDAKLERFLRAVDKGVRQIIEPTTPLVLAGVDDITARFRNLSEHPTIVTEAVSGNVENLSPTEIHTDAVKAMMPRFEQERDADATAFLAAGDQRADTLTDVVTAAMTGRVESLFIVSDEERWGRVDHDGFEVVVSDERRPGDVDLLDVAASEAWAHGGRVHAVEAEDVPGTTNVAAVLRY